MLRSHRAQLAAAALLALSTGAASAQNVQYFAQPPLAQTGAQAAQPYAYSAQGAVQTAAPDLASVYAAYAQPVAAQNAAVQQIAQNYAQPAASAYPQPVAAQYFAAPPQQQTQQTSPLASVNYAPQASSTGVAQNYVAQNYAPQTAYAAPATYAAPAAPAPIYNPAPAPQQAYAAPYAPPAAPYAPSVQATWPAPSPVPPPAPIGGAQPAYPGYGYAPQQTAYAPPPAPGQPSLAGWERSFAGNIEAVNACLKATALTDVSVNGVITESISRETHVILNGRFSASTPPRREFCAWSPTRRDARMLDATGRPQFEGEGSPSYAPVGARFSFANLAALQPVVDTDYRLLGWMRWEKTGVQAASNAAPKPEVLQTLRVQGYRWK